MRVELVVAGFTIDAATRAPVVVLKEREGNRLLPIWVGPGEAAAISAELEGVRPPRPMTHDLLRSVIEALGGQVTATEITDYRDDTYFALVRITQGDRSIEIDARPSDAIALSLRAQAPVWCSRAVLDAARTVSRPPATATPPGASEDDEASQGPQPILDIHGRTPAEVLAALSPEAFGKYKM